MKRDIDLSRYTNFQQAVWRIVKTIPEGETRSYSWVAKMVSCPGAAQAVGQALKGNPYPGIIPCHRVIRSDGSLGGFSQGLKKKEQLLKKERKKKKC